MRHHAIIRAKIRLMVVLFIFLPFCASSVDLPAIYGTAGVHSLGTKKHPIKHSKQVSYGEFGKESEGKGKAQGEGAVFLSTLLNAFSLETAFSLQRLHKFRHVGIAVPIAETPLYLYKRTLLI